jgi:hypothetical protein
MEQHERHQSRRRHLHVVSGSPTVVIPGSRQIFVEWRIGLNLALLVKL